jgi:N-acetylmuramoyl-L-alanine amidase
VTRRAAGSSEDLLLEPGGVFALEAKRLSQGSHRYDRSVLWLAAVLGAVLVFWPARELRSDNFVVYLPEGTKTVPIQSFGHADYVPLLQVLNMVVHVDGMQASQSSLKVWFGPSEVEVHTDDKKVRVNKASITLQAPVRSENGEWLVPLDFMASALPQLTRQPVQYRVGTRRIFIGNTTPGTFSVSLKPLAGGADISVAFTEKMNFKTEAANGRWVLFLSGRPLEPLETSIQFQNPFVKSVQFDDQDGVPKLIVTPASEGLNFWPTLSSDGKLIEAQISKQPPVAALPSQPPANLPPGPPPALPQANPAEEMPAVAGPASLPLVVLDPGHGGPDPGSHDKTGLLEKDLVLALATRVRTTLVGSGRFRAAMTRSNDSDPTFDHRDEIANVLEAWAFVSFHAGDFGGVSPRAVVYTFEPPSSSENAAAVGLLQLIPWDHVQEARLERSQELGAALQQTLAAVPGLNVPKATAAPARVLRSVTAPAVAIEIGSFAPDTDASPLSAGDFEQQVADAVLKGLDNFKKP